LFGIIAVGSTAFGQATPKEATEATKQHNM